MYYIVYFSNNNNKMYSSIVTCDIFNPIEFAKEMLPPDHIIVNWKKLSKDEEDEVIKYIDSEE